VEAAAGGVPPAATLRFAESLVMRLCHDLAGAMSTMSNALEMASEEAGAASEALSIAVDGGVAMTARLRLLRAAWGGGLGAMTVSELVGLTEGLPSARRVKIDSDLVVEEGQLPPAFARVLLNVVMLAAESLPHGGTVTLSGTAVDGVVVMISGRSAAWPAGFAALLAARQTAWATVDDPRRIGAGLTALLSAAEAITVSILMGGPAGEPPPLLVRPESGARGQ
jgi:histidine phosphotransferase ChpT